MPRLLEVHQSLELVVPGGQERTLPGLDPGMGTETGSRPYADHERAADVPPREETREDERAHEAARLEGQGPEHPGYGVTEPDPLEMAVRGPAGVSVLWGVAPQPFERGAETASRQGRARPDVGDEDLADQGRLCRR